MTGEPRETVLELVQVVAEQVLFGNDRQAPTEAVSFSREAWGSLGHPTTVTVTVAPGGEFVGQEDPTPREGLSRLAPQPYSLPGSDTGGAYL